MIFVYVTPDHKHYCERDFPAGKAPAHVYVKIGTRKVRAVKKITGDCGVGMKCVDPWRHELVSYSLGVHPKQIEKAKAVGAKYGVDMHFNKRGQRVFPSRRNRRDVLRVLGMVDFDGGYGDGYAREARNSG